MLIFGTRGKSIEYRLDPQHALLLTYSYFHFFWLLRCAYNKRFALATLTPYGWARRPFTEEQAREATRGNLPKPNLWDQWSLLGWIGISLFGFLLTALNS